jgi:hypothetical protein
MSSVAELTQDGNMLLLLTMVHDACVAGDTEFLEGPICAKIFRVIPESMVVDALGGGTDATVPLNIGKMLSDKVKAGHLFVREKKKKEKVVKSWFVTHPCGFSETIYNIKEFAEDMGILPSGLGSVANNSMRQSYMGFKIRRIS